MNKKRWEPIEDEPFYEHGFLEYWREEKSGGWRICVDNRGFSLPDDIRLCRRVEIDRPRPDWSQAPAWAQSWTVDANGNEVYHEDPDPYIFGPGACWLVHYGKSSDDMNYMTGERAENHVEIPIGVDWRTLIEQRPEATHENPA